MNIKPIEALVLHPEPGDVVVLQYPLRLSMSQAEPRAGAKRRCAVSRMWLAVLDSGATIAHIKPEKADAVKVVGQAAHG